MRTGTQNRHRIVISVSIIAICLLFIGTELFPSYANSPTPSEPVLPVPLVGDLVQLPAKDYQDRPMPQGRYVLVTLPICESCAKKRVPIASLSKHWNLPLVIATHEGVEHTVKAMKIHPVATSYFFQDEKGSRVGPGMSFYAPRAALVDGNGRILKLDMESDSFDKFIQEVTR